VDALIKANKDFDLVILPNRNLGAVLDVSGTRVEVLRQDPYFVRKRWDYFVKHLLGVEPPQGYTIGEGTVEMATPSGTCSRPPAPVVADRIGAVQGGMFSPRSRDRCSRQGWEH
jgi:hypothetical protein